MGLAWEKRLFNKVRDFLQLLVKRRGQAKEAIAAMVELVLNTYLPQVPSREEKFAFLNTLREICDGKMFLEREYATITRNVVEMYEHDGKIDEAARIIQEIAIETYGSLKNKEKVDFILY